MSHPFDELNRRIDPERERCGDEMRESSLVNRLLVRTYGAAAPKYRHTLTRLCEERTGRKHVTFPLFNELHPSYPVVLSFSRLGGVKVHADPRCMLAALIKSFAKTPFYQYFEDWLTQARPAAGGRQVGMVFGRRGFKYGMIIHDGGLAFSRHRDTVITHAGGSSHEPVLLGVQWFDTFVDAIAAQLRQ